MLLIINKNNKYYAMAIKIGETIPLQLSEYLKMFTTKDDRADVNNEVKNVSVSSLRELTYRNNRVTEGNMIGLKVLLMKANKNADEKIKQAKNCKKEIRKVIDFI